MDMGQLNDSAERVAVLTGWNNHTGAIIEIAEYIQRRDNSDTTHIRKALQAIEDLHHYFGDMPPHLSELRQKIQDNLFKQLNPLESLRLKASL